MRDLVVKYLSKGVSRRNFVTGLTKAGLTMTAAQSVLSSVSTVTLAQTAPSVAGPVKTFEGHGGAAFAEQLIASGVKYVFGNSASEDAQFYEALVDRPQLKYILTPHEGPGAAMAAGYVKASGEPAIVMQAGVVGMANAIGQMFNAHKEQTPLVVLLLPHRPVAARRARRLRGSAQPGADGPADHQVHLARAPRRHDPGDRAPRLQGGVDPALRAVLHLVAFRLQRRAGEDRDHPAGSVRPAHARAAQPGRGAARRQAPGRGEDAADGGGRRDLQGEGRRQGGEARRAARHAGDAGAPALRQLPGEAIRSGSAISRAATSTRCAYPKGVDVVINVGNKFQHNGPNPIVPRGPKFIDMRIDHWSMGNVMLTEVPLVADVGYGLDDMIAAVEQLMTASLKQKAAERAEEVKKFSTQAKTLRGQIVNSPDWDQAPLIADRLTWEVAQFADPDAIIVHEAGSVALHCFDFNPLGGRELFFYYGAHLGSGVGTAAGVKLARPNQQVICLVGDGSFTFGPTALWNMARLQLPVITVVYNNHAYGGPHSRVINNVPGGRMVQTGQFVHDYLGNPGHGHGLDRQGLRGRRRSRAQPDAAARGAGARAQAHGRGQALPARRPGRPQGRRLGAEPMGAAHSRCRDAHPQGVSRSV